MAKSIPVIITNTNILVYDRFSEEFKAFTLPGISTQPNIPFYHSYAKKIAESQHYFKAFIKNIYPNKTTKNILAIVVCCGALPAMVPRFRVMNSCAFILSLWMLMKALTLKNSPPPCRTPIIMLSRLNTVTVSHVIKRRADNGDTFISTWGELIRSLSTATSIVGYTRR